LRKRARFLPPTDFHPRPKRAAAEAERVAIRELAENEQSD
jgi:hypothetical protein